MKRPDLDTFACVNPACQRFRHSGVGNLVIRKVYGPDHIRLLRCRTCGEEFSERRGTALFNTQMAEATATDVIHHLDEGWSVRATARLVKVSNDAVARLLRVAGRHAPRFHDQPVPGLTPKALEFDEQWSFVKKSSSGVGRMKRTLAIWGIIRPLRQTVNWWSVSGAVNGPTPRRTPSSTTAGIACVRAIYRQSALTRMRATSPPA
jgi:transposase-like protein